MRILKKILITLALVLVIIQCVNAWDYIEVSEYKVFQLLYDRAYKYFVTEVCSNFASAVYKVYRDIITGKREALDDCAFDEKFCRDLKEIYKYDWQNHVFVLFSGLMGNGTKPGHLKKLGLPPWSDSQNDVTHVPKINNKGRATHVPQINNKGGGNGNGTKHISPSKQMLEGEMCAQIPERGNLSITFPSMCYGLLCAVRNAVSNTVSNAVHNKSRAKPRGLTLVLHDNSPSHHFGLSNKSDTKSDTNEGYTFVKIVVSVVCLAIFTTLTIKNTHEKVRSDMEFKRMMTSLTLVNKIYDEIPQGEPSCEVYRAFNELLLKIPTPLNRHCADSLHTHVLQQLKRPHVLESLSIINRFLDTYTKYTKIISIVPREFKAQSTKFRSGCVYWAHTQYTIGLSPIHKKSLFVQAELVVSQEIRRTLREMAQRDKAQRDKAHHTIDEQNRWVRENWFESVTCKHFPPDLVSILRKINTFAEEDPSIISNMFSLGQISPSAVGNDNDNTFVASVLKGPIYWACNKVLKD
jgi:hypothetical protein